MTKLDELWDQAIANRGTPVDIGRNVACDDCGEDFTDSTVCGGFMLDDRASCPLCAERVLQRAPVRLMVRLAVRAQVCPEGVSFADFVRSQRTDALICVARRQ